MPEPLIALVSTVNSVLAIDVHTGRYEVIDRGRGVYYGIARTVDGPLVATRRQGITDEGRPEAAGAILVLSGRGDPALLIEPAVPLRDLHQLIDHQGTLLGVCSFDEHVALRVGGEWAVWSPIPGASGDEHHLNSVLVDGAEVHVLAHNWDEPSAVHHFRWPAGGPEIRCRGRFPVVELEQLGTTVLGRQAHNLWIDDGRITVCSSAEGDIVSSDGARRRVGGYPRGLAVGPDRIVVGRSLDAPRERRARADAELAVFDRAWNHLRDIILPGEGMVLDVRMPGVPDECDPGHDDEPWRFSERGGWHRLPVRPA